MTNLPNSKKIKYCLIAAILIFGIVFQISYMYQVFGDNIGAGSRIISNDSIAVNIKDVLPIYSEDELNYYVNKYYPNIDFAGTYYGPMTDRKLIRNSDLIIRGTVIEVPPAYETQKPSYHNVIHHNVLSRDVIYHNVIVEVKDVYKGSPNIETIKMERIGGVIETRAYINSVFNYRVGDEVILYLKEIETNGDEKIYGAAYPTRGELFVYENRYWDVDGKEYELIY